MTILAQLGEELNGWVTTLGGIVVITVGSIILQKWHEHKMRQIAEKELELKKRSVQLQRINNKLLRKTYDEIRILNACNMARGGRK